MAEKTAYVSPSGVGPVDVVVAHTDEDGTYYKVVVGAAGWELDKVEYDQNWTGTDPRVVHFSDENLSGKVYPWNGMKDWTFNFGDVDMSEYGSSYVYTVQNIKVYLRRKSYGNTILRDDDGVMLRNAYGVIMRG